MTAVLGGLKELIATTVEDGGDLRGIIDIATKVTIRILNSTVDRPPEHSADGPPGGVAVHGGWRSPADVIRLARVHWMTG
jgi:hypothetical protein